MVFETEPERCLLPVLVFSRGSSGLATRCPAIEWRLVDEFDAALGGDTIAGADT